MTERVVGRRTPGARGSDEPTPGGSTAPRGERDRLLFDRIAKTYARKDLVPYCARARKARALATVRRVEGRVQRILEIGCGAGFASRYLDGRYELYVGVDHAEELIRIARDLHSRDQVRFVHHDACELVLEERFDLVLMIGVLHHVERPEVLLRRVRTFLAENGVVAVNEPQRGNPLIGALRTLRKWTDPGYSRDQVFFTKGELVKLFKEAGFSCEVAPQGVLSTPFAEVATLPAWFAETAARIAVRADEMLEQVLKRLGMTALSWNLVVIAWPDSPNGR